VPRESYVRPPLLAREPRPRWQQVWPFRAAVLIALALLVWLAIELWQYVTTDQTQQDPDLGSVGALVGPR
jgi:hypothetical protein